MHTSQPTVSEHIQNLESDLSCKLFDRLGRTILPTVEADLLYQRAKPILDDLNQLREDISASRKTVSGKLIIGASTIPGTYLLPRLAASLKQDFPQISFEILIHDSATTVERIANHELFIGVVGAKPQTPKVQSREVGQDELILAAAKSNPIPEKIDIKNLAALPFIMRERGSGTRKSTESLLLEKGFSPKKLNICATLGSSAAVREAIKADLGLSILSKLAVLTELDTGTIKQIHIDNFTMKRSFYLVTPTKRSLPNNYQQLVNRLLPQ